MWIFFSLSNITTKKEEGMQLKKVEDGGMYMTAEVAALWISSCLEKQLSEHQVD